MQVLEEFTATLTTVFAGRNTENEDSKSGSTEDILAVKTEISTLHEKIKNLSAKLTANGL